VTDTNADKGRAVESLFPEVRFLKDTPELRIAEDDGAKHITGYASVFGKLSRRLGNFKEVVSPEAFNEARSAGFPDVVCRYNHDDRMVLGTTNAGTCTIQVDEHGLQYDVLPPRSRDDVLELVQRRDVRYSSFAFRCQEDGGDEWGVTKWNEPLRTLLNVELVDVAPVMDPAYKDTTAAARSMNGVVDSLARWVHADPAEVRSMLEAGQAIRFFKRSDRPSVPSLDKDSAEVRTSEPVDDKAATLRTVPEKEENRTVDTQNTETEERKVLSSSARKALPDSDFAYIEPGGAKVNGRTKPNKLRHYPIHDANHVRNALARIAQGKKFAAEAAPKVHAAASKFGIGMHDQMERALVQICEQRMNEFLAAEEARKGAETAKTEEPETDDVRTFTPADMLAQMAELRTKMVSEFDLDFEDESAE
jgi:uncharacterized protein